MASLANKLFGGSSKESSDGQALNWHQPEAVAMMHANELANTGYGHDHFYYAYYLAADGPLLSKKDLKQQHPWRPLLNAYLRQSEDLLELDRHLFAHGFRRVLALHHNYVQGQCSGHPDRHHGCWQPLAEAGAREPDKCSTMICTPTTKKTRWDNHRPDNSNMARSVVSSRHIFALPPKFSMLNDVTGYLPRYSHLASWNAGGIHYGEGVHLQTAPTSSVTGFQSIVRNNSPPAPPFTTWAQQISPYLSDVSTRPAQLSSQLAPHDNRVSEHGDDISTYAGTLFPANYASSAVSTMGATNLQRPSIVASPVQTSADEFPKWLPPTLTHEEAEERSMYFKDEQVSNRVTYRSALFNPYGDRTRMQICVYRWDHDRQRWIR